MKAILREGMEEGAYGMSTGLDYPPGSYASTQELIELSKEGARLGGVYHTHVRNTLGDQFLDPLKRSHRHWPLQWHTKPHYPSLAAEAASGRSGTDP